MAFPMHSSLRAYTHFTPFCLLFACYVIALNIHRDQLDLSYFTRLIWIGANGRPGRPTSSNVNNRRHFWSVSALPAAARKPSIG